MRIWAVANQKGGVGKTTTTLALGRGLAALGHRVLLIDLDPHASLSRAFGVPVDPPPAGVLELFGAPPADLSGLCHASNIQGLDYVCAQSALATLERRSANQPGLGLALQNALARHQGQHDYILLDCPPSLGLLTVNALVAAAEVLIPIQCEYYALEGLEQLLRTVDLVRSHLNDRLALSTILLTMYDARTRLASQVAEDVRGHFGGIVLDSVIPRSVRVSEAPSYGQSVITYDGTSSGALAYLEAARELAFRNVRTEPAR